MSTNTTSTSTSTNSSQLINIEIKSSKYSSKLVIDGNNDVSNLKSQIINNVKVIGLNWSPEDLKLLCKGKFLKDDGSNLISQGLKDGSKVMLMVNTSNGIATKVVKEVDEAISIENKLKDMKNLTEKIAERVDSGQNDTQRYFEVTNQAGEVVNLPPGDKKALVVAMTMHQKGRSSMSSKSWKDALNFLTSADEEFSKCSPSTLSLVDNVALLQLDITWCYYQLKDPALLSDADDRLGKVEDYFKRSHGENLERLEVIRGGFKPELALYVRLYSLQSILAWSKGNIAETQRLLSKAEKIVSEIDINDDSLAELLAMGFTYQEAARGLRSSSNNTSQAINYVLTKRKEVKEQAERDAEERAKKKEQRLYGRTANGSLISIEAKNRLLTMGFQLTHVIEALKQSDNQEGVALNLLTEKVDLLEVALSQKVLKKSTTNETNNEKNSDDNESIASISSMGFDVDVARIALRDSNGNAEVAVNSLLSKTSEEIDELKSRATIVAATNITTTTTPTTTTTTIPSTSPNYYPFEEDTLNEVDDEIYDDNQAELEEELVSDLDADPEAYLDVDLIGEKNILSTYRGYLGDYLRKQAAGK